jgi:hypothetical protein
LARSRAETKKLQDKLKASQEEVAKLKDRLNILEANPELKHLKGELERREQQMQACKNEARAEISKLKLQITKLEELSLTRAPARGPGDDSVEALEDEVRLLRGLLQARQEEQPSAPAPASVPQPEEGRRARLAELKGQLRAQQAATD